MAVLFDTLKLADRLEAAGMPQRQAHEMAAALADTLTGTVATAADIAAVRSDIEASELRLRTEIAELQAEVRGWLTTQAFAIIGANAAVAGIVAALVRLLH